MLYTEWIAKGMLIGLGYAIVLLIMKLVTILLDWIYEKLL
jgi:hypothetical protein